MNRDALQKIDEAKQVAFDYEPSLRHQIQHLDIREVEGGEGVVIELADFGDYDRTGYLVYDPAALLQMERAVITNAILEQARRLWLPRQ